MMPHDRGRRDAILLFAARSLRLFSYGSLTVCLLLYLGALGLSSSDVGVLLTAIFAGDLGITLWLTAHADRFGRKRTLLISAALKMAAGLAFSSTSSLFLLSVAGIVGVISPAGGEIGPFLAVEQAGLAQVTKVDSTASASGSANKSTNNSNGKTASALASIFGWYNAAGYIALASGAVVSGWMVSQLQAAYGLTPLDSYRQILHLYAAFGAVKMCIYAALSPAVETEEWRQQHGVALAAAAPVVSSPAADTCAKDASAHDSAVTHNSSAGGTSGGNDEEESVPIMSESNNAATAAGADPSHSSSEAPARLNLSLTERIRHYVNTHMGLRSDASRRIVAKLSALFAVDAFAGGFVMQSVLVRWFAVRWGLQAAQLGTLLMAANVAGGISSIGAGKLVSKIGAVNTMVWTHLPSNILLGLVPLMPSASSAVACLLLRFCLSQMDVPARQAYVASVVAPDERSAASGITNVVRSLGVGLSPLALAYFSAEGVDPASSWYAAPFWVAAGLKCAYDLSLYAMFSAGSGGGGTTGSEAPKPHERAAAVAADSRRRLSTLKESADLEDDAASTALEGGQLAIGAELEIEEDEGTK